MNQNLNNLWPRYSEYSIWTGVERRDMRYFWNTSDDTLTDLTNLSLLDEEQTFYSTVTFDFNGKLRNQHPNFIATCLCKVPNFKVILCTRSGFWGWNTREVNFERPNSTLAQIVDIRKPRPSFSVIAFINILMIIILHIKKRLGWMTVYIKIASFYVPCNKWDWV